MQDEDSDTYNDIPEDLRNGFNHHYNDLCDHLRGQASQKIKYIICLECIV